MRRPSHTPPASGSPSVVAGRQGMTTAQRRTLQTLLFTDTRPAKTLGEVIDACDAELEISTLSPYTKMWRRLGFRRLSEWRGCDINREWRSVAMELYRRHGQSPGSIVCNTLGYLCRFAKRRGWRDADPDLDGLARIRCTPRTSVVQTEHRAAFLAALDAVNRPRRVVAADVLRLLLWTGMRLSEACRIEWDHVSLADRVVMLPKTKARRPRSVWLCDEALAVLERQPRGGRWVFPRRDGLARLGNREPQTLMRMVCKAAGIPHATPHVLRHTWGTEAMRAGVPIVVVSDALGHLTIRETQRYQHARTTEVAAAMVVVAASLQRGAR